VSIILKNQKTSYINHHDMEPMRILPT